MSVSWKEVLKNSWDHGPVDKLVDNLLAEAVNRKASDIHFEPQENNLRIRLRIDGMLYETGVYPKELNASMVSRLKIIANLNIAERRLPQDGRCQLKVEGRTIDFRVSVIPTIDGEKVVLRILDKECFPEGIHQLDLRSSNSQKFDMLLSFTQGMILVTGPTGCGKTTTLYSILQELNNPEKNITTIEDPIEYKLTGINQVQVNTKAGFTYATALRAFLRQDPNIIMLGEIRDKETAAIAIRAALTGHLVLSTLHTTGAPEAVIRLLDMGIEPYLVAAAMVGVIAQRLVRTICSSCQGKGCHDCLGTGYKGRTPLHEIMLVDKELRRCIQGWSESAADLREIAIKKGMVTLKDDGLAKVQEGKIRLAEVLRVISLGESQLEESNGASEN